MYRIVKFYEDDNKNNVTITRVSTLKEAQKWCNDDQTSSMTADKPKGCANDPKCIEKWHNKKKHWFYGYTEE